MIYVALAVLDRCWPWWPCWPRSRQAPVQTPPSAWCRGRPAAATGARPRCEAEEAPSGRQVEKDAAADSEPAPPWSGPTPAPPPPAPYVPPDPETIGVSRRQFFNRTIVDA